MLKVGGRFVMVMATGDTRWSKVYHQMKTEERWRELLGRTRSVSAEWSTLIGPDHRDTVL